MASEERLDALEERVAALEAAVGAGAGHKGAGAGSDGGPGGTDPAGEVGYRGVVTLDGELRWTIRYGARGVLDLPAGTVADVLAALGHPIRVMLVRRLLTGPATAAELREAAELSSTGKLYHHLRALTGARVVEQDGHHYRVPSTGVVPVLVAMLAAGDLGGVL